jgi:hypothetical protein
MASRTERLRRRLALVLGFLVFPMFADHAPAQDGPNLEIVAQMPHLLPVNSVA